MAWFRTDDSFPTHRKVLAIPRRDRCTAVGLWQLAGTWSAGQLTDGHVPAYMLPELASSTRVADLLVRVGLWETTDDGYLIHDYLDYNPSAEEVRQQQAVKHEAKVRAGRSGGIASGVARRKHKPSTGEADAKQDASTGEAKRSPDPTPTSELRSGRERPPLHSVPPGEEAEESTAQRLVGFYVDRHTGRVAGNVRGQIGKLIKGLLAEGFTADQLEPALTHMVRKGLHPSTLPSVVSELSSRPAPDPDRRLSGDEVTALIGPDSWTCPTPPAGLTADEQWEWRRDQQIAHIADRQAQARNRQQRVDA